jgi:hypothetical protein
MKTSLLAAAIVIAGAVSAQMSQSLPNGLLAAEGSSSSSYPFATANANFWHWNYDTSNFTVNYPILIHTVSFRANEARPRSEAPCRSNLRCAPRSSTGRRPEVRRPTQP